jgi:hypothetical protein
MYTTTRTARRHATPRAERALALAREIDNAVTSDPGVQSARASLSDARALLREAQEAVAFHMDVDPISWAAHEAQARKLLAQLEGRYRLEYGRPNSAAVLAAESEAVIGAINASRARFVAAERAEEDLAAAEALVQEALAALRRAESEVRNRFTHREAVAA